MVEVGRHQNIKNVRDRVCPFCPGAVEDEFHFVFDCGTYRVPRQNFISPITKSVPGFKFFSKTEKLEFLMCKMDKNVCKYIANCMEIRSFLESKPKQYLQYQLSSIYIILYYLLLFVNFFQLNYYVFIHLVKCKTMPLKEVSYFSRLKIEKLKLKLI